MTEESYFKEKRVINVVIGFPLAKQDATRKIAGELEITSDGVFLTTFYENRSQDEDLKEWPEILTLSGFGSSKRFRLFLNNQIYHSNQRKLDRINSFTKIKFKCEDILVCNNYIMPNDLSEIRIYIDGLEDFLSKEQFEKGSIRIKTNEFLFVYHVLHHAVSSEWSQKAETVPFVIFHFPTSIKFCEKKVKELVKKYQVLHSFLTGKHCKIKRVLINNEIEFYSNSFNAIENEQSYFRPLKYSQIPEDVILNWFHLSNIVFENYQDFYKARYIKNQQHKFTQIFGCFEVLVSEYQCKFFDDDTFNKIFSTIEQAVEKQADELNLKQKKVKKFIKKIKYVNSTEKKVALQITECAEQENITLLFNKNKELMGELFDKITNNRDLLSHGRFNQVTDLQEHTDILCICVYFIILQRLGIEKDILLENCLQKNFYIL